jgi:DNA replication protein DnaD
MIEKKIISDIKKITSSIMDNSLNQDESEKSLNEIHTHFQQITGITRYNMEVARLAANPTAKGKALVNHAALCLLDYRRTVKFLKAIVTVILYKQKEQPGELINVFYAGCGP